MNVRDERGIALPLALVALVAVTFVVTSALVTSSNELAIGDAQRAATQALYAAETAANGFVAEQGSLLAPFAGTYAGVELVAVHLGTTAETDFYSIRARAAMGREVMMLVAVDSAVVVRGWQEVIR